MADTDEIDKLTKAWLVIAWAKSLENLTVCGAEKALYFGTDTAAGVTPRSWHERAAPSCDCRSSPEVVGKCAQLYDFYIRVNIVLAFVTKTGTNIRRSKANQSNEESRRSTFRTIFE